MFKKSVLICLFFIYTLQFVVATPEAVSKTALVLHLPTENNLDFQRELRGFKQRVDEVRQLYGQVWLVIAASLGSEIEKVRFHDPRWVFWNLQILEEDGIHADGRLGIRGDGLVGKNWQLLAEVLGNSFDFITDDWAFEYPEDEVYNVLRSMHSMLRFGGQSMMKMQNFHHLLSLENEEVFGWIDEKFNLGYTSLSTVPFRHGAGGSNVCQSLAYAPETRHTIPKGSKCDLYLKEIEPAYREKEDIALVFLSPDSQAKTQSFLCRLANKSPTSRDCWTEGMQLLIDEAKLFVAQTVKGWKPPVARNLTDDDIELYVGSIVFEKKSL